jgi:hypothetical protein
MLNESAARRGATSVLLTIPVAEHAFDAIPNGPSGSCLSTTTENSFLEWASYARICRHPNRGNAYS